MQNKSANILVTATAQFLPQQSSAKHYHFLWAYEITIVNQTDEIIQLLNRYWRITDMQCRIEEVRGPGVIGLQPLLKPGKQFAYSSFCQLETPQGAMEGHYEMQTLSDEQLIVEIPKFILTSPATSDQAFRSMLH